MFNFENWTFEKAIKGKKNLKLKLNYVDEFSFEYMWKIQNELTGTSKVIQHSTMLTELIQQYKTIPSLLNKLEASIEQFDLMVINATLSLPTIN